MLWKKRKHQQVLFFYHFAAACKDDSRKTDFDANLLMILKKTLFTFYSFSSQRLQIALLGEPTKRCHPFFFYDISKSGSTLKSSNQRIILIHCLPGVSPDAILKPGDPWKYSSP